MGGKKTAALLATAAVAVVVLGFAAVYLARMRQSAGASQNGQYPGLSGQVTVVCPAHKLITEGGPGITPRTNCTPAFTAQDVRDYLARGFSMGKIGVTGKPTVTRIVFLTIHELGQATGDSEWEANYPGNLMVCYVGLSGTFSVSGPPSVGRTGTTSTASIVFDATTGNGLVMGTPDALAGKL
jgi:hypothetical protein